MIEQVWLIFAGVSLGIALLGGWPAIGTASVVLLVVCVVGFLVAPDGHPDFWSLAQGWEHALGISALYIVLVGPSAVGAGGIAGLILRIAAGRAWKVMGKKGQGQ
jgi:hypothetical protein